MVKKLLCAWCLLLCLLLPTALADTQVADNAHLFTEAEIARMTEICDRIEETYQVDMFVLTSDSVPLGGYVAYADDYYDNHHFGIGEDEAGMLYLVDMSNRQVHISTKGIMIDYITDSREEGIFDAGYAQLRSGEYGESVILSLLQTESHLQQGRTEGQFRYDETTGVRYTSLYNALTTTELLVAAVAALAVAGVFILIVTGKYQLRGSTYSYDRYQLTNIQLTRNDNHFMRESVSRVRHPDPPASNGGHRSGGGGGSGTHVSSSGSVHGGGSRGF